MNGVDKGKLMRKTVLFFLLLFFQLGRWEAGWGPSGGSDYSNPTLGFLLLGNEPGTCSRGDGDRC